MNISGFIKKLQNIMRNDAGVNGDAQRIEQIGWMLFLYLYDAKEAEWEITEQNYESVMPEEYRWRNWAIDKKDGNSITGDELVEFINKLFNELKKIRIDQNTPARGRIVREVFTDLNNYMKDGVLIRQCLNVFNELKLEDFKNRHAFNDIYEQILKGLQSAGNAGEFYTPRAITELVTQIVNPKLGDKVADFACGTGGFLVSALNHINSNLEVDSNKARNILRNSFYGVEKKSLPYLLCTTNMLLHDIDDPEIIHGNSLETNVRDYEEEDKFDVILMNPPYGGNEKKIIQNNFPTALADSETADLFLVEIIYRLKQNGRCGIVLPDGLLFGSDNTKTAIKKKLIEEFNLHTIIRLPGSIFAPYTSIATNLLFFDKTHPTEEIWFYRMDLPEGRKAFNKTNPVSAKDVKCVIDWLNDKKEIEDEKTEGATNTTYKARKFTAEEIESLNYNLDQCGYPQEEQVILSPEETINNFIAKRENLEAQIDQKLEELKALLEIK